MLKRPPQHRSDAVPIFVHPSDEAWDNDRITAELQELGDEAKMHPVARYLGGWTRYDLDAQATVAGRTVTAREYIDESKQPTLWKLRRLSFAEWYEIQPLVEKALRAGERPFSGYLKACICGLANVDNGPTLEIPGGRLNAADVAKLYEIDQELPYAIGEAVYQASIPLTESEGKR